ncbi:preprotein translocase subunit YajC, partial [Bacillus mycoides]|uniref:preprotein translocase subunit YajC n=1 Tax=Bacillus mycoides TaxID=1405 RepID=UPI001642BA53
MNGGMMNMMMIVGMFGILYLLLIGGEEKGEKGVGEMESELKKGDGTVRIGGLQG